AIATRFAPSREGTRSGLLPETQAMVTAGDIRRETTDGLLPRSWRSAITALRFKGFAVARFPLALFVLLAAGLKAHGFSRLAFDGSFLTSRQMQAAAVEAEIVIACLLLWGRYARLGWLLAISFFALVGGISFYVALTGQRYCPSCFGVARIPSWATGALDAGIVALLAVCRPEL